MGSILGLVKGIYCRVKFGRACYGSGVYSSRAFARGEAVRKAMSLLGLLLVILIIVLIARAV